MLTFRWNFKNLALIGLVGLLSLGLLVDRRLDGLVLLLFMALGVLLIDAGQLISKRRRAWRQIVAPATILALLLQLTLPFLHLPAAPVAYAANFTVNSNLDTVDANPGDNICADAGGNCTLRAAIMEANALAGPDTISLPADTYLLNIGASGEDANVDGDLDVIGAGDLTINGVGAGSTVIDGNLTERVLHHLGTGTLEINGVTIQNGSEPDTGGAGNVNDDGGGIMNEGGGTLNINDSVIMNNQVTGAGEDGGGIANTADGIVNINNTTISNNTAPDSGGGVLSSGGATTTVNITNSTISGNTANDQGGGIWSAQTVNLANSTVSGNTSTNEGGGVALDFGAAVTIINTTITENNGTVGTGIWRNNGVVSVENSIVANNNGSVNNCSGTITDNGANIDDGASCGFGNSNVSPLLLGPLQNNGGSTFTHALWGGSPAIDAANDATCAAAPVNNVDQRGQARPVDAPGFGTTSCDIGAYEFVPPELSVSDSSVTEDNPPTNPTLVFTITLSFPISASVTVDYTLGGGSATGGNVDYDDTGGTLTFPPGVVTQNVNVLVTSDLIDETPNETFDLTLTPGTNVWANINDGTGVGTIIDDDGVSLLSIDDASVIEGNTGTTNMDFTVRLSNASASLVTVPFTVLNDSAILNEDYNASTTTSPVIFAVGTTVQTITIPIVGETVAELDETFQITLGLPAGATLTDGQAIGTIVNDDGPLPTLSIGDATSPEGNGGPTTMEFSVQLSAASSGQVSVDYVTNNGTAVSSAANDYDPATGTLIFAPGQIEQKIMVVINGDTIIEPNETFTVILSNPRNAILADDQATGTITNDDVVQQGSAGSDDKNSDDDDDEDVPAPPPPPPAAPPAAAPPAAAPPAAPQPAPAAEAGPLPVTTLPNTGVDGSRTAFPWLMVLGIGFGAMALAWGLQRRRRNSRQTLQASTQPGQRPSLGQPGSGEANLKQKEDPVSDK